MNQILAVIITKQYGAAIHYEHADIVFEQCEYDTNEDAKLAINEIQRLDKIRFGTKAAQFFLINNLVYYCDVYTYTKKAELKKVVEKVKSRLIG